MQLIFLLLAFFGLAFAGPLKYSESNTTLSNRGMTSFGPRGDIWPKRSSDSDKTLVPYCYANKAAMSALQEPFEGGVVVWKKGLGQPGSDSGHSLWVTRHLVPSKD
jgi:hypothetical protein